MSDNKFSKALSAAHAEYNKEAAASYAEYRLVAAVELARHEDRMDALHRKYVLACAAIIAEE